MATVGFGAWKKLSLPSIGSIINSVSGITSIRSKWEGYCKGEVENPQFFLVLDREREVRIRLKSDCASATCGMKIVVISHKKEEKVALEGQTVVTQTEYETNRKIMLSARLKKGQYIVFPILEQSDIRGDFKLKFYSPPPVQFSRICPKEQKQLKSKWTEFDVVGTKISSRPKFFLKLKQGCDVTLRLRTHYEMEKQPNASMLIVSRWDFHKLNRLGKRHILTETKWTYSNTIELSFTAQEAGEFLVVPCHMKVLSEATNDFSLQVQCLGDGLEEFSQFFEKKGKGKQKEASCRAILNQYFGKSQSKVLLDENPVPAILEYCKSHQCVFQDDIFDATEDDMDIVNSLSSLSDEEIRPALSATVKKWQRPSQFLQHPELFVQETNFSGVEPTDAVQGQADDNSLIVSLASLSTTENFVKKMIFPQQYNPYGVYCVKIFKAGEWKYVVIDDYLPLDKRGQYVFGHSQNHEELWVSLMEKAIAKCYGSYRDLGGRRIEEILTLLTGGSTTVVPVKKLDDEVSVWKKMKMFEKNGHLMCATSNGEKDPQGIGLISNHGYSVISLYDIDMGEKEKVKLLKIRNTWGGSHEWKGKYGDTSRVWKKNPELVKLLNFQTKDDGEFFMEFKDFARFFRCVTFCEITSRCFKFSKMFKSCWTVNTWGEIDEDSVAGCHTENEHGKNPKISLVVKKPNTGVLISLYRKKQRILIKKKEKEEEEDEDEDDEELIIEELEEEEEQEDGQKVKVEEAMYCMLVKKKVDKPYVQPESVISASRYLCSSGVKCCAVVAEPGIYWIIPCTQKRPVTEETKLFNLVVEYNTENESDVEVGTKKHEDRYGDVVTIADKMWSPNTPFHDIHVEGNPKIWITVDEEDTKIPLQLMIVFRRKSEDEKMKEKMKENATAVGLFHGKEVVLKTEFVASTITYVYALLPPSPEKYLFVPTLRLKDDIKSGFEVSFYSSNVFSITYKGKVHVPL